MSIMRRFSPRVTLHLWIFVLLTVPQTAGAIWVHAFDCKNCHIPTSSVSSISDGRICLQCHDNDIPYYKMGDGFSSSTNAAFNVLDASNAFDSNGLVEGKTSGQTSHNWGAPDIQPAAGAKAPNKADYPKFYTRNGASHNRVTCSRCHDVHGERSNPQLLTLGAGSSQQMCLACHVTWNQGLGMSNITHPVNISYAAVASAAPEKYAPVPPLNDDNNPNTDDKISLFDGKILCGSCHQVHFADSDATTPDVPANSTNLSAHGGDGMILRSDGSGRTDTSALCRSCHIYQPHGGDTGERLGCLACHSGHANDDLLRPNYYMLRKAVTTASFGQVTDLDYSSPSVLNAGLKYTFWNDQTDGTANGYCEKCHGDAVTIGTGAGTYHVASAICTDCHKHGQADGAFAAGCNACHGMPPVVNLPRPGDGLVTTPASTGSPSAGQHGKHAVEYSYPCATCHFNGMPSTPVNGNNALQIGFSGIATGTGTIYHGRGALAAPYVYQGTNGTAIINDSALTCSNTYCHSNGTSVATGTIPANSSATWDSGALDCSSCHGNPPTYASGSTKANSHAAHQDYTCDKCHSSTTTTGTAITGKANHVNQAYNVTAGSGVSFTYTYAASGGTCSSISCHNNGSGTWGTNTPCSSCHSDIKSLHIATPETGRVAMHQGGSFSVNCTSCHSLSLLAIHANDCGLCHESTAANVSSAIASWNGTCGACHESNHAAANSKAAIGHAPYGYDKCTDLCHAGYPYASKTEKAHISNCFICHVSSTGPNPSAPPTWARASNGKLQLVQTYWGKGSRDQQFVTPTGVTALTIDAYGATGSEGGYRTYAWIPNAGTGGLGGRVQAELPVAPLQVLTLRVGLSGGRYQDYTNMWRSPAGWPNGGSGADPTSSTGGGSGGGSTSVLSGSTVLIEAGGGAGGAYVPYGGNADGKIGGAGGAVADSGPGGNQTGGSGTSFGGGGGGGGWTGGTGGAAGLGGNGGSSYLGSLVGTITPGVKYADLPGYLPKDEIITRPGLLNISWSDEIAPVTTSDAAASYSYPATVALTATDSGGSGVAVTRYRLDGGDETTGNIVTIPGLGTSQESVVRTLTYYSIDNAGNVEDSHLQQITMSGDPQPPSTTTNVKPAGFWGTATLVLTATDADGSGVASTRYRLDGAAETTGTSMIIPPPATGVDSHTLEYWSTDNAGNIEEHHFVTFTVVPGETTPPATTSDCQATYTSTATITLSATDSGSGVDYTRYRLDGGSEATGTVVSTSAKGTHTLEFWSVDNAGNVETHKTVTFRVGAFVSQTFAFTGTEQSFTVPDGVTEIEVDLFGAQGGLMRRYNPSLYTEYDLPGGRGGGVHAHLPVTPGAVLTVITGGQGGPYSAPAGGYPNGASGGYGGGGGSSFIASGETVLVEAGAGSSADPTRTPGPGGAQGSGQRHPMDDTASGGGGGWNHGGRNWAGYVEGGTSFIASGTGTLTTGVRQGNGEVSITWFE